MQMREIPKIFNFAILFTIFYKVKYLNETGCIFINIRTLYTVTSSVLHNAFLVRTLFILKILFWLEWFFF